MKIKCIICGHLVEHFIIDDQFVCDECFAEYYKNLYDRPSMDNSKQVEWMSKECTSIPAGHISNIYTIEIDKDIPEEMKKQNNVPVIEMPRTRKGSESHGKKEEDGKE